ncbi:MAG: hypothetical protein ACKO3V_03245 [Pirellula sp.]
MVEANAKNANLYRDGGMLVVPFDTAIFPCRCIKSNQEVQSNDYTVTLDCSSSNLYNSDARLVATAVGGKVGKAALAIGEMLATRKKLNLNIGLCESKKQLYRRIKFGAFGLLIGGPLVAFAILIPLIQLAEPGTPPNAYVAIFAAVLGAVLFITGIVLFAISNLGLLRPRKMNETHVWLDGAGREFLDSIPAIPANSNV